MCKIFRGLRADIHVDSNSQQEDAYQGEVEDGVNQDRDSARLEVPELDESASGRYLEEEAGSEEDEQHDRYENGTPVRHWIGSLRT